MCHVCGDGGKSNLFLKGDIVLVWVLRCKYCLFKRQLKVPMLRTPFPTQTEFRSSPLVLYRINCANSTSVTWRSQCTRHSCLPFFFPRYVSFKDTVSLANVYESLCTDWRLRVTRTPLPVFQRNKTVPIVIRRFSLLNFTFRAIPTDGII